MNTELILGLTANIGLVIKILFDHHQKKDIEKFKLELKLFESKHNATKIIYQELNKLFSKLNEDIQLCHMIQDHRTLKPENRQLKYKKILEKVNESFHNATTYLDENKSSIPKVIESAFSQLAAKYVIYISEFEYLFIKTPDKDQEKEWVQSAILFPNKLNPIFERFDFTLDLLREELNDIDIVINKKAKKPN
jgi:nanoRNase/pAp phosphatase (c-di-AMP/oligoRNAs hydrolase)